MSEIKCTNCKDVIGNNTLKLNERYWEYVCDSCVDLPEVKKRWKQFEEKYKTHEEKIRIYIDSYNEVNPNYKIKKHDK